MIRLLVALLILAGPAGACDLALILASDVSTSLTAEERAEVRRGNAEALRQPGLAEALAYGETWIMLADWAGQSGAVTPWRRIGSADDLHDLALIAEAPSPLNLTAGTNMARLFGFAAEQFAAKPCAKQVLDVMTDGEPNSNPMGVRDQVFVEGTNVVNIIAVTTEIAVLQAMQEQARFGWGGFVMPVATFADFPAAMRRKLLLEVSMALRPRRAA